jgi:hypothetical protein
MVLGQLGQRWCNRQEISGQKVPYLLWNLNVHDKDTTGIGCVFWSFEGPYQFGHVVASYSRVHPGCVFVHFNVHQFFSQSRQRHILN